MERRKQTLIAAPLLALILIAAGVFYVKVIKVRSEYNRVVTELINAGKNQDAAPALQALHTKAVGGMKTTIAMELAETYRTLGDDPALNYDESRKHFARAHELDPEGMQPHQMRVLQSTPSGAATSD